MGLLTQTTTAPRYSPQMMKQMQDIYGYAGKNLMQDPAQINMPEAFEFPEAGRPSQVPGKFNISSPNVRDIQKTQLPEMPEQPTFTGMDFAPIEQQAREGFYGQTVPTLSERFTSMGRGARGSSAFSRTLGAAGAGMESSLAALKAKLIPQWEMQKAQYGLQRGQLGLQRAGLGQKDAQMQLQRDLGLGGLEMQRGTALGGLEMQRAQLLNQQQNYGLQRAQYGAQYGLQRAQLMAQQQQSRRRELLGLLGFKPPVMYGQPQTHSWTF